MGAVKQGADGGHEDDIVGADEFFHVRSFSLRMILSENRCPLFGIMRGRN
jgi:hypothetical protein